MAATATIKPAAREWITGTDGISHSQPVHGRERAACGAPRLDPRFHRPDLYRERCAACLERDGLSMPAPSR